MHVTIDNDAPLNPLTYTQSVCEASGSSKLVARKTLDSSVVRVTYTRETASYFNYVPKYMIIVWVSV
jgi:hypothetical protein